MIKMTMTSLKHAVFLVAVLALAVFAVSNVSAFADITSVEVSGIEAVDGTANVAAFAGQTIPVRVIFEGTGNATDVRVQAWLVGDREFTSSSERFVVDSGKSYSRLVSLRVPFDIDPSEDLSLKVAVESKNQGIGDETTIKLGAQRESYLVEVLDVDVAPEVKTGETLVLDVVLKNRGREEADDTFVRASIPALGISDKGYFGDLSPEDQSDPDKEDSGERRVFLKIPANTKPGVYVVEIEAFNSDSATTISKKVNVVSGGQESKVVAPTISRNVGVGQTAAFTLTIVNTGNRVSVYELAVDAPSDLDVDVSEPVLAVPAGTSRTVQMTAQSDKVDDYTFTVNVHSEGQLIATRQFAVNVGQDGSGAVGGFKSPAGNATVLLTVVLAIIFVVLLVVLIVLLTRKTDKSEEYGESYY
jgi:uncharacterized membrane protein